MSLLPVYNEKKQLVDGEFSNLLEYCKKNCDKNEKCLLHYKKLSELSNSGFYPCPHGLVSFINCYDNQKVIFTGLRVTEFYKKKNQLFLNDISYTPIIPKDKILSLIRSQNSLYGEKKELHDKLESFNSLEHEVKNLNSRIQSICDTFVTIYSEKKDIYQLTPEEYLSIFEKIKTLYVTSNLIKLRYTIYDYDKNNSFLTSDSLYTIPIHGKFMKCSKILQNYKKNTYITFDGNTTKCIKGYSSFEFIPFLICENALKYSMDNKAVKVIFSENRDILTVRIISKSLYCSQDDIPELFLKGKRGKNAISSSVKGDGLGLYFVKLLCDIHNVEISVSSDPKTESFCGKLYSDFTVTLKFKNTFESTYNI